MFYVTYTIVKFCADECARQNSGEKSVARMVEAYHKVLEHSDSLTPDFVIELAYTIEPKANENGLRFQPVSFANGNVVKAPTIEAFERLISFGFEHCCVSPETFYQEFEALHPFKDGNGRVGAILFNLLNGTLGDPITPPPFKN
jgi:hypothetical protein